MKQKIKIQIFYQKNKNIRNENNKKRLPKILDAKFDRRKKNKTRND